MNRPAIVGTGLICLDAIRRDDGSYWLAAGGSCINPMLILREWGWDIHPIGLIGTDRASELAMRDLARWNFNREWILRSPTVRTPVYIQVRDKGGHRFLRECPVCGHPFAGCAPPPPETMKTILAQLPVSLSVCLIERVSEAALLLAEHCERAGVPVHFEPNREDDPETFRRLAALAGILKYSAERFPGLDGVTGPLHIPLEIQTLGADGLRYRTGGGDRSWRMLPSSRPAYFEDAAGAGDWTTAALLRGIAAEGRIDLDAPEAGALEALLNESQASAAENCAHTGARGLMYRHTPMMRAGGLRAICPGCR